MSTSYAYPLTSFGRFMTDRVRSDAYAGAMRDVINPDSLVLNIGAGTGFFAILAAQMGARRVVAIEINDVIDIARELARANDVADRIEFIHDFSPNVSLDEQADVIVSDLRGVLPLFEQHIPTIVDARKRLLKPGGVLLSRQDQIKAALVRVPTYYERHYQRPWLHNAYKLDLRAIRERLVNDWHRFYAQQEQLVVEPQLVATLDYMVVEDPSLQSMVSWSIDRPTTTHGLLVWFDTTVHGQHGFSNQPGPPKLIYGQALFPFEEPITLQADDHVSISLRAKCYEEDYVWSWHTRVDHSSGMAAISFQQSSIWTRMTSLTRRVADQAPES